MAPTTAIPSLQEVRSLAHKLYIQFCDSSSAFRPLQRSVRALRNELEETDELIAQNATNCQLESRVVTQAASCYLVLQQLDLAMQQFRSSADKISNDPGQLLIPDFRIAIDLATHEFATVCGNCKPSSKIGELNLDSACCPSPQAPSLRSWPSIASETLFSSKPRESCHEQSDSGFHSLCGRRLSGPGSIADSVIGAEAAEEKQVLSPRKADSAVERRMSDSAQVEDVPSWRAPFAMVDPMSVPLEEATMFILKCHDSKGAQPSSPRVPLDTDERPSAEGPISAVDLGCPNHNRESSWPDLKAAPEGRTPSPLPPLITSLWESSKTSGDSTSAGRDLDGTLDEPSSTVERDVLSPEAILQPVSAAFSSPLVGRTTSPLARLALPSPAQVPRAPSLPPPPVPRRSKTHSHDRKLSQGRYRVVNATPEEAESDDELYTTSRPSSTIVSPAVSARTPPTTQTVGKASFANALEDHVEQGTSRRPRLPPHPSSSIRTDGISLDTEDLHDDYVNVPPPIPPKACRSNVQSKLLGKTSQESCAARPELKTPQQLKSIRSGEAGGRHHKNAEETLKVKPLSPVLTREPSMQLRSHDRPVARAQQEQEVWFRSEHIRDHYGPVAQEQQSQPPSDDDHLDEERLDCIVVSMNSCAWDEAELHLSTHLAAVVKRRAELATRRTRHLLGVCASFQGRPQEAINYFKTVIRTPIRDIAHLDVGDCAAAYWLGDAYALLNRKAEALLAYSIAAQSPMYQDPTQPRLQLLITAEQESCEIGLSKSDLSAEWFDQTQEMAADGSILHPNVLSFPVAMTLLFSDSYQKATPTTRRRNRLAKPFWLRSDQSRGFALHTLHTGFPAPPQNYYYGLNLTAAMLTGTSAHWPIPYDPFFCLSNVSRGSLLPRPIDLLHTPTLSPTTAPASSRRSLSLSRNEIYTSPSLPQLVRATRKCLADLEIQFTELSDPERGPRFACRYSFMQKKIATTHYFSLALVRPLIGSGHAIELAGDGIVSSRLAATGQGYECGVKVGEVKGLKGRIREALEKQEAGGGGAVERKRKKPPGTASKETTSMGGAPFAFNFAV
ncbi:hypothetical protein Tdes44962_MAKER07888 [Teratosphaeria destructans]|uniref:Uncharacterized protein n=1 Tax=Teratosphaeria destructans TaxID=418781 RepID=A0A9W7W585_9PEZI|nr:hypothetical protein Tdes44962_MAKER07888 [Teratosphaeria destructans]